MTGKSDGNGGVTIHVNPTYVALLSSIAGGIFTLCTIVAAFAIRMEHRVTRVETLLADSLERLDRNQEDTIRAKALIELQIEREAQARREADAALARHRR